MFESTVLTALLFGFHAATAQQFQDHVYPYDLLGLSSPCFAAVNTTVESCPGWLAPFAGINAASFELLADAELQSLCGSTCQADLTSLRKTVVAACTAAEDVVVPDNVAYPATFFIDRFLYAAGLSCLKDAATGTYCDTIVAGWLNQTTPYTKDQNCSDCSIAIQAKQLASPFGYDDEAASAFASTTSSCAANVYTYATPTVYALNTTTGAPPMPTCTTGSTYVIQTGDTCNSIAGAQGVATEALVSLNGIDLGCNLMPPVGTSLCLPPPCTTYQLDIGDTCDSITAAQSITLGQFLAWNPPVSASCQNLQALRGMFLCVSSPVGTISVSLGNVATTEAPIPTNTQGQSTTPCGGWYTVVADDTCASISIANSITLDDFYFLNPQVDTVSCNNLWLNYAYCVKAVGNIQTYPGYPVVVPSTTFTRPPPPTETPEPVYSLPPLNPQAPGTIQGCAYYDNGYSASIAAQLPGANTCARRANAVGVTVDQLIEWNPSLDSADCVLLPDYSYCLIKDDIATTTAPPSTTTSSPPASTSGTPPPPAETQTGAAADCTKWYVVQSGDGCWAIADANGISLDDFYKWNPGVGSNCETLWLGYAVCVGV